MNGIILSPRRSGGAKGREAAMTVLYAAAAYAALGLLVAIAFVSIGVTRVLEPPRPVTLAGRLLIIPGSIVLWPYVLMQWLRAGARS
jgi:hypothetical protein